MQRRARKTEFDEWMTVLDLMIQGDFIDRIDVYTYDPCSCAENELCSPKAYLDVIRENRRYSSPRIPSPARKLRDSGEIEFG